MKTYYKVVSPDHGSITCGITDGSYVQYTHSKWTRASRRFAQQGYHLLVFKTLLEATQCANKNWWDGLIYECTVKGHIKTLPIMLTIGGVMAIDHKERLILRDMSDDGKWPQGTVMAKKVRLDKFIMKIYM